jgi:putative transposase
MDIGNFSETTKKKLIYMLRRKKYAYIHDRIRVILWGAEGQTAKKISERLGKHIRWVQRKAALFRDHGLEGLFDKPRSGQPKKLPEDMTDQFCNRLRAGPLPSDSISVFHAKDIQKILLNEFNCHYTVSGIYKLLHRLKFSWITSRPVHEKNDPQKMKKWLDENEAFLQDVKKSIQEK